MDKKIDRLRRQQQRLWRKVAVTILSLHHNLAILLAFMMISVLGIFWVLIDQKLESHLLENARAYGYGISRYAADDLKDLIISEDVQSQQLYLQRLSNDPLIIEARLFDHHGKILAISSADDPAETKSSEMPEDDNQTSHNYSNTLKLLEDINNDKQRLGIIQIEIDRTMLEGPVHKLLNILALFTVFLMIFSTFISWIITKRLTRSLRKLLKFPINSPEDKRIQNLDISAELKRMLDSPSTTSDSPAPVSKAEESGIHQLLAADSIAHSRKVIILKFYLPDLANWLKPDSGTHNVSLLRKLDRLLIMTIHSQQGHLLSFDGMTAQACFGLDGNLDSAVYRSVSCSLLLKRLLADLSLIPKISLRKEQRLLIHHLKRTPVVIPINIFRDDSELLFSSDQQWLLLHNNICDDKRLLDQMKLSKVTENWYSIKESSQAATSMLERQLTWISYLLND